MPGAAGYILILSESRAEVFDDQSTVGPYFAEAVPEFEHSRTAPLVIFVSTEPGYITHIAQGSRGVRAGTDQRRLNLTEIYLLKSVIPTASILEKIGAKVRRYVEARLSEGGLLPPASFSHFISAVIALAPELRELLNRYSEERRERIGRLSEDVRKALAAQKEALKGALLIADIDRTPLLNWTPDEQAKPTSFLDGLVEARLTEDQMIWHDLLEPLPGFQEVRRSITGAARFESKEVELEVLVANRLPLERQTGADLIYFNATFNSFVLVQYKAMEKNRGATEAAYRLPDAQLAAEIARMDTILRSLNGAAGPSHRNHFRLNTNPFFLKLCPRIVLDPDSVGLTPGMYLPLDYWRFIEKDNDLVGKRGGRIVTYRNVGRYFDNTEFATIVRAAWIGTTPQETALLAPLVQALLAEGRAVVIAVKSDKPDPRVRTGESDPHESEDDIASLV